MPSINDWAAKAADRVVDEVTYGKNNNQRTRDRVAAIIATFAEPLMTLLRDSRREHEHGLHGARCCPQCTCESWPLDGEDVEADFEPEPNSDEPCTCGADVWNQKVDDVISGAK